MKIGRRARKPTDVDITSLIDVMFLLVIFFMVATSFHEETRVLEITLPRAEKPKIITLKEGVLTITVTGDNRIFIGEDEIQAEDLRKAVTERLDGSEVKQVIVRGDIKAEYRYIAAAVDAANIAEAEGISFAVLYTSL